MAIPKIIHQVWEGRTEPCMPTRLQILARTWREQNPDWEYHLWNGEEMDELVEKHFPEYLSMYRSFPYNVQRWDTIRYMILYVYGGVYTDLDTECFKPIEPLLEDVMIGFGEEPPEHNFNSSMSTLIGNAFMVSEPRCGGWIDILKEITDAMLRDYPAQKVMHTTGPLMISRVFNILKKRYEVTLFPYSKVTPVTKDDMGSYIYQGETASFHEKIKEAYCSHYFFGSWGTNFSFYN